MARQLATLTLASQDDASASFSVEFTGHRNDNRYLLWLSATGYDQAGERSFVVYLAVVWDGDSGACTVPKNVDPNVSVAGYRAFIAEYPEILTPVSNEVAF